jgi:hypothetical protein
MKKARKGNAGFPQFRYLEAAMNHTRTLFTEFTSLYCHFDDKPSFQNVKFPST